MIRIKNWKIKDSDKVAAKLLKEKVNIGDVTSKLLVSRGICEEGPARAFLFPDYNNCHDPFLLKDMNLAVERIISAISSEEKIWVFGDYDVDGITSISVLKKFFESLNVHVNYYIPDRFDEGYGLSKEGIDKIKSSLGDLIITVDCGISSVELVKYANELGLDVIVTDHHKPQDLLPEAIAVVNPNRADCGYPFKYLAGVGVAFKLVQALGMELGIKVDEKDFFSDYLDIVSLGTIADIVPLIDENRIFVKHGLDLIRNGSSEGIQQLILDSSIDPKEITAGRIGYSIAPKINASGRIGDPYKSVELLVGDQIDRRIVIAKELNDYNKDRQEIEKGILKEALKQIEDNKLDDNKIIVVAGDNWNSGVVGIVASRISEKYYKPSIVLSIQGDEAKGSARSVGEFSIFDALNSCKNLLLKFGGHSAAAGLTILSSNIDVLRAGLNNYADINMTKDDMVETLKIDLELDVREINHELLNEIDMLKPFGMKNPKPLFSTIGLSVDRLRYVGKDENHLKLTVENQNRVFDGIGFNMSAYKGHIGKNDVIDLAYYLDSNEFMGVTSLQMGIKDIRLYDNSRFIENVHGVEFILSKFNTVFRNKNNGIAMNYPELNTRRDLKMEKNTLYIVSSMLGLKEILYYGEDYSIMDSISINYGEISEINDYTIIVNPLNNKKFDIFANIVYYDFCEVIGFESIGRKFSEKKDIESLKKFYKGMKLSRNELVDIYKVIRKIQGMDLRELFLKEDNDWPVKFLSGLIILKKNGLIEYNIEGSLLKIENIIKADKKVDIFNSKIYTFIKNLSEFYLNKMLNIENF